MIVAVFNWVCKLNIDWDILNLYYLFIDLWKYFSKLSEFFVKAFGARVSLEVIGVLSDWTQHRLCSINTIRNFFYFRYLGWSTFLMKTSWTVCTQNLVMVTAVASSWIRTEVIFTIKSIQMEACITRAILN